MKKHSLKFLAFALGPAFLFSCSNLSLSHDRSETPKLDAAPVKVVEAQPLKSPDLTQVTTSANVKAAHEEVEKQLSKMQEKEPSSDEMSVTLKPTSTKADQTPHGEKSPAEKAADHEVQGVTADVALGWLKNGNKRFVTHHLRADGQSLKDVKRLAREQKPHTIVFASSDSRVVPEIVFDEKLGELFVIRTLGEALDPVSVASAEYALKHFGVHHILVLGNTNCEAVKTAFAALNGEESENSSAVIKDILPRLQQFKGKEASPSYVDEVVANADGVAQDLPQRSAVIEKMLKEKKVQISTAIYNLNTGKVSFK